MQKILTVQLREDIYFSPRSRGRKGSKGKEELYCMDQHIINKNNQYRKCKKSKRIGNSNTHSENIQSKLWDGIWHEKLCHANNEKRQTTPVGRNGTTKSRKIRTHGQKKTYKYLGMLEADTIKQVEMKERIKKEYLRRKRKLPKTKVYCRNLIERINAWAVPLVRYSGPFLN